MTRKARDYAAERARRDIRARQLSFKSYNDYERARRNKKARDEGFKSYYDRVNRRKKGLPSPATLLAHQLVENLMVDKTEWFDIDAMPSIDDEQYWDWFRIWYSKSNAA